MQRMQRKVGKVTGMHKTADDAQVSMLIHDFEAADKMLETLIDASKHWRDSWADILNRQSAILSEYDNIVAPIVATNGGGANNYTQTPRLVLERVNVLKVNYLELKTDMLQEVAMVDKRIIEPAKDARTSLKQYKKVVKKREDRKLDYERYKAKVEGIEKKVKRTDKENTALVKYNIDLDSATSEYHAADDELKATLPGMTNAAYSLLPPLLNAQIMIQNTLLGQLYTTLHGYCQDHGFPSPPPEMDEIIAAFEADFTSLRLELEGGIKMIAAGKAIHQPMAIADGGKSYSGMNLRTRAGGAISDRRNGHSGTKPAAIMPSPSSKPHTPQLEHAPQLRIQYPGDAIAASSPSPAMSRTSSQGQEYFSPPTPNNNSSHAPFRLRQPSSTSMSSLSQTASVSSIAAAKKKPPPPPPKRMASQQFEYVTALYDFPGENAGDLSFREGDRIRIVKKTGSNQDWWDGELRGVRGSFPANYCGAA